jgi:hypothetical protein
MKSASSANTLVQPPTSRPWIGGVVSCFWFWTLVLSEEDNGEEEYQKQNPLNVREHFHKPKIESTAIIDI